MAELPEYFVPGGRSRSGRPACMLSAGSVVALGPPRWYHPQVRARRRRFIDELQLSDAGKGHIADSVQGRVGRGMTGGLRKWRGRREFRP